ncbi:unnamed protein product, partial [Mesorhabditis belari]|uniref:Acetoacetyl-CoA synthetase n=1 Tax=Mesorhabditis belari TaxID=2138241 RepID=A0AAF3J957_9BILA
MVSFNEESTSFYKPNLTGDTAEEKLRKFINDRQKLKISSYDELHEHSCEHYAKFWRDFLEFSEIIYEGDANQAVDESANISEIPKWFPGVKLNYAENLLKEIGDNTKIAITAYDENLMTTDKTRKELREDVGRLANALRQSGVTKDDVVCGFMPNSYETIVAALATAALGAAWSSASLDFGPSGVLDRFKQVKPKVMFTVNATTYKQKLFDLREKIDEIVGELPSVEKVILINNKTISPIKIVEYKCRDRLILYEDFVGNSAETGLTFERIPFGHPLFVMFSSGTTGVPKAMVHTVGGTLLKHIEEHQIQNDANDEDSMFFYTTCGWMMWNWTISLLALGGRLILYDESPLEPDHYVMPKIIGHSKATIIGMGAQLYDRFEKIDPKKNLCKQFDLQAVRLVLSTGSPLKEAIFEYINACLAPGAVIGSISGGTDIIGCFMGTTLSKRVVPGQCTAPFLGMDVKAFNLKGESLLDEQGELVCLKPFPSMPSHFLNDKDKSKYLKAYFERFPGVWAHGDYCIIDSQSGGITMLGRSDATLNRGGVRMGTAEIYNVVDTFVEIADCIVVGRQIPNEKDEEILLFVKLSDGAALDDHLRTSICKAIRERQSPRHVPNKIIPITDIPYTNSGKKVEIAVKQIVNGFPVEKASSLRNPDSLDLYAQFRVKG